MAAELPVCDVLCEAMEYLSKLGSNLRTRSESLKEKRISKAKLKNAHAVHKAANKVLLICELSKKSLENVEAGVRKVLSIVDASQAHDDVGGKNIDKAKQQTRGNYFQFEFETHKLRISKKIPIKHYMSVQVFAESLPSSVLEKYPVYYDCQLKRRRRTYENKINSKSSIGEYDTNGNTSNKIFVSAESESEKSINRKISSGSEKTNEGKSSILMSYSDKNATDCKNNTSARAQFSHLLETEGEVSAIGDNKQSDMNIELNNDSVKNKSKEDLMVSDLIECFANEAKLDVHLPKNDNRSIDSENDNTNCEKYKKGGKETISIRKKFSKIKIIDDNSESDDEPIKNNESVRKKTISCQENNDLEKDTDSEPKSKKIKSIDNDSDNNSMDSRNSQSEQKKDDDSKPIIRCVNITKLLKPNILGTNNSELPNVAKKKQKSNDNIVDLTCNKERRKNGRHDHIKQRKNSTENKSDDEFWALKRSEVKKFKSKKFTVHIERLPQLSTNFLITYNLKRILQGGKTVCAVTMEKEKDLEHQVKNIDEVKKALLNDSASEDTDSTVRTEANQVKNTLLNNSDSDKEQTPTGADDSIREKINDSASEDTDSTVRAEANKVKKSLLNNSDSDKEQNPTGSDDSHREKINDSASEDTDSTVRAEANKVKKSLLNNSDSDKEQNPTGADDSHREKINDSASEDTGSTVRAEANKVKKSLLNNSDSDKEQTPTGADDSNREKITDPAAIKDALLNESESENNEEQVSEGKNKKSDSVTSDTKELEQEDAEKIKSALLNDSDSDKLQSKESEEIIPALQETNNDDECDVHSSGDTNLLKNNKEDNLCHIQSTTIEQNELGQDAEKIKSSLLNDSSDPKSEPSIIKKKKKKLKHKQKHTSKSMKAKKMLLHYSSSSDSEEEHPLKSDKISKNRTSIQSRRKSHVISSSSSSNQDEDTEHKRKDDGSGLPSENMDQDQVDGTIDEHSNPNVSKMVRSKAKPSGSSSQNSDNQEASDKDIDGLTNLNSLNKSHRRRDTSTNNTESRSSTKNSRSKPTSVIGENLLDAMSSSDASEDDNKVEEDLPPVNLSGLNGGSIGHLAKDDLLGDSDSSGSHNKEQDEVEESQNAVDSEEEESVTLKRRKANAISSDSEGGTSRRKQNDEDVRVSDFEDSEDESSESVKRSKRKKKASESDASGTSSTDGGKKKRRRIKLIKDSDASGSDTDNEGEGRNKHGRKNIRKVMGKNQLEEATKKAAREEKERIARITERQKLYNNLDFDESGKPDEVVLEKVVLDFDPETKEPLIEVDRGLVKKLKPHQANGIKFMWDACFESVKRIKKDKGSGCILAHCMGLGKTLQVISLTHTLLIHGSLTGVNRVLVVCPLSTVLNWVNEFKMWLKHAHSEFEVDVYELSRYKQNSERAFQLQQWFEGGGVCVLGYEMFRNLSADNNKKFKKKMLRSFQESLVHPGPDLVVCDEGHLLKNEKTSLSQSMNRVKTLRRIVLTGTPLQNNLKEYYCMVQFVKPNLLGKYNEYLNRFVNPITNGQYTDSTEHDIKIMKRRSHVLHKMLDGAVQRRDYGVLAPFLPPKHEYVLFITLSDIQVKLYQFYLDNYSRRPLPGKSSGFLFPDFQSLQRIWTHPLVLKYNSERYEIMQQKKREREEEDSEGSLVDFIDDDSTPEESSTEESSDDLSDVSDDSRKKSKKKKSAKKSKTKESKVGTRRGTRANPVELNDDEEDVPELVEAKNENPTEWWIKLVEDEELDDMRNSHKLVLLFDILRQCETIGDKLLVFSQSLYSLDLIEHFLGKVDEATQEGRVDEKLGGHIGSWSPGVDYFRLDGSTSCENRSIWCKNFNREDNPRARLFLISTRAGGLGINLVAANRVVIFDVSWNPSHDVQSIFRVYRFGQKKPCYVYRFLAMGTMEEKIYERQVTKQAISKRVIDEQQIDRHYAENDLAELYKFEARPDEPRPLPSLPKDRLFAEMLKEHEAQIYKYHEHDSLLENKEEETLSEEERKAAWEDFENEKNKPPPAPFPSAWPMHNGMVPGLLAQQQQQLAYAALAAMLRKDMPNINDNQIRDMLPLIYNSNPGMFGGYDYGLMQKMSEIYKYTQPGMMNPGMMNPVMNPAASGGGPALGGASGLQYEPPWQRQHQQQQQMRLQQLMQQNQMGAKFYAGGLGSRDPVAMALQQQRAREIMMGGAGAGPGAARPRGRPPLAPRAPPPSADVVNLDSD